MRVKTKYSQQTFLLSKYMWLHMENTKWEYRIHLFFLDDELIYVVYELR